MTKTVVATIQWLRPEDGGRSKPPSGPTFAAVVRLHGQQMDEWLREAWTVVLTFIEAPDESLSHRVRVAFLAEGAPRDLLSKGSAFELTEGPRTVAKGSVIGE